MVELTEKRSSASYAASGVVKDPVLFNDWHAVAKADELKSGTAIPVRLLDTNLVLWRGSDMQAHAWEDRCPHRSVQLSAGWVSDNLLVCAYHGLVYNSQGQCVKVPACPDYVPPKQARVQSYQIQERYGLLFVNLGESEADIPPFLEWDDPHYLKFLSGPYYCRSGGYRAIENFLDLAHFPFIHRDILGVPEKAEVPDYQISIDQNVIRFHDIRIWQPDPVGTGEGAEVTYNYWVFRPLTAYLQKVTDADQRLTIFFHLTPVGEEEFLTWMWVAVNYGNANEIDEMRSFQDHVATQDLENLERHNPKRLPLNLRAEFHTPCDRGSLAYRKWLRKLGVTYGVIS